MAFHDLPIRRKITGVILLTSVIVLLMTTAAFTVYDLLSYRRWLVREFATAARRVAEQAGRALAEGDAHRAEAHLAALASNPHVMLAGLYDLRGNLLASYPPEHADRLPLRPKEQDVRIGGGHVSLFEPVLRSGNHIGTLYLQGDLKPLSERLEKYGGIALLVMLGSLLAAAGMSGLLGRRIADPILKLAAAVRSVSDQENYSTRVPKLSHDEVGDLTDAFNQMLARVEEASRAQAFLAAIVQSSDDAIVGKDLTGQVVSWNKGAERLFGYTAAEMVGQPIMKILSPSRPDEESRILNDVNAGRTWHLETVRMHKSGREVQVSLTLSPIRDSHGRIIGVSSIARDVTEQHRAQEQLQEQSRTLREQAQLLELANVLARDLDDRIILWSKGMERLHGWTREEAIGKTPQDLLRSQTPQPPETLREILLREGSWQGEVLQHRKDGTAVIVSSHWMLHRNDSGTPAAILEVCNDITERKRAEQEILRLNAELEERVAARTKELTAANRELEAFTYSVAHDLRAPLRHIDAFSRILDEDYGSLLPPEGIHFLKHIRRGGQSMTQLVDDLLNLARVGRQELKKERTSLRRLVDEVLQESRRDTEGRDIDWRIHDLPEVDCDPGLMKQVFANLLSNAIKYTRPRPHAVIEIGTRIERGVETVFVRDNGVGFNMKYANKLFGVFQRLHRADEFEGTGVGLATVDRIIQKHGGRVWAHGVVGEGASLFFTLGAAEGNGHGPLENNGHEPAAHAE